MASGDEGLLTISIGMRVSPEPEAIELLRRYNVALNYAINKILRLNLRSFRRIHNVLYRELMEWFGLPSRIAIDSYRDALANAKAWIRNPKRGRKPRVKKLSMLLHPGSGYRVKEGYVEIIGGIKLSIIGWDKRYDGYENGEARLVYRGDRMILWISEKIPKPQPHQPRDVIAVDINEKKMV
jgi:transposase